MCFAATAHLNHCLGTGGTGTAMRMRRRVVLVLSALRELGVSWISVQPADATPTVLSVTPDADYDTITVVFAEGVSGRGTGDPAGALVATDLSVAPDGTPAIRSVTHEAGDETVVV